MGTRWQQESLAFYDFFRYEQHWPSYSYRRGPCDRTTTYEGATKSRCKTICTQQEPSGAFYDFVDGKTRCSTTPYQYSSVWVDVQRIRTCRVCVRRSCGPQKR